MELDLLDMSVPHHPSQGTRPCSHLVHPPTKTCLQLYNMEKFSEITLKTEQKSEKEIDQLTFGITEFVKHNIW
jgi:hypothetical protein